MVNGQTIEELIEAVTIIRGHGIVLTEYTLKGVTPDGNELEINYDVKNDERFQ